MKLATGGGKIDEVFDVMEMLRDEEKDLQGKSGDRDSFHRESIINESSRVVESQRVANVLQHHKFSDDG